MFYLSRVSEKLLINVRLVFLLVAFVHLLFTAFVTLSIDTTVDPNPKIRAYYYIRWLLITCWFNLITLAYLPVRLYCDWNARQGAGNRQHVIFLRNTTDIVMTAVLVPTTVFSDIVFWSVFLTDVTIMGPVLLFDYVPRWANHSLHTVSLIVVLIDLIITPRKKPRSLTQQVSFMTAFLSIYLSVIWYCLNKGLVAYAVLEFMTTTQKLLVFSAIYVCYLIIFKLQWILIESIWKRR